MTSPPGSESRTERPDTKTLLRLGQPERQPERASDPTPEPPQVSHPEVAQVAQRSRVRIWFKGIREPVRAHAALGQSALLLDAPLPFLELESVVRVMTSDGDGVLHGRIRRVQLQTGGDQRVPRLCVELGLTDAPGAGEAADLDVTMPALRLDTGATAHERRSHTGVLPLLGMLLLGLAAGASATYAWATTRTVRSVAAPRTPSRPHAAQPEPAPLQRADSPSIVMTLAAETTAELVRSRSSEWLAQSEPLAPYAVMPPGVLADDIVDEADPAPPPEVALELEPGAPDAQSVSSARGSLEVRAVDVQARVFIPMRGTADDMRRYALTTPGVAIILPHAVALAPLENYAIARGLVRRVWLRRLGAGVQVRVITKRPPTRTHVTFDENGLTILLDG